MLALLVMLNNYFHDLATAVFAVVSVAAYLLHRQLDGNFPPERVRAVIGALVRIGYGSLAWVILGGVLRALAYRRYEWMGAAGEDQVPVLAVKHVILVGCTVLGLIALHRARRALRGPAVPRPEEAR